MDEAFVHLFATAAFAWALEIRLDSVDTVDLDIRHSRPYFHHLIRVPEMSLVSCLILVKELMSVLSSFSLIRLRRIE